MSDLLGAKLECCKNFECVCSDSANSEFSNVTLNQHCPMIEFIAQIFGAPAVPKRCQGDVRGERAIKPQMLGQWACIECVVKQRDRGIPLVWNKKDVGSVVGIVGSKACVLTFEMYRFGPGGDRSDVFLVAPLRHI